MKSFSVVVLVAVILFLVGGYHYSRKIVGEFSCFASNAQSETSTRSTATTIILNLKRNDAHHRLFSGYQAAELEDFNLKESLRLGYDSAGAKGCSIWNNTDATNPRMFQDLREFMNGLDLYTKAVQKFSWTKSNNVTDIRKYLMKQLLEGNTQDEVCKNLEVFDRNISIQQAFFSNGQGMPLLSRTRNGWVEPILPPMRHPRFCFKARENLFNLDYLVHDFATMCRQLHPTSRIVLFDLGASPIFADMETPWFNIMKLYHKFGFHFDHIYAYEITNFDVQNIYNKLVPAEFLPAYHWINTAVSTELGHPLNPWTILEQEFNEDDLVIVKLDIDTPWLELPLAQQLLNSPKLCQLVDQFYFEHHVRVWEMRRWWRSRVRSTVKDTLELFIQLREQGVASHFWV